jgi:hypothetical protein
MSLNIPNAKDLYMNAQSKTIAEQISIIEDAFKDLEPDDDGISMYLKSELHATVSQQLRDKGYKFILSDANSAYGRYFLTIYLREIRTPLKQNLLRPDKLRDMQIN